LNHNALKQKISRLKENKDTIMRIKLTICLAILLIANSIVLAQSVSVQWLKNSMGTKWDLVSDMVMDKHNNTYLACNYTALSTREKLSTNGEKDIYIAKYNQSGKQIWYKQINTTNYCHISSLELDSLGRLLISGFFTNELKLGKELLHAKSGNNAFIAILDTTGKFSFAKNIEGNFKGTKTFFRPSRSEPGYCFAGSYTGDIVVDEITYKGNYKSDIFICKFNEEGVLLDYLILEGKGNDQVNDMIVQKSGDIYLTGSFEYDLRIKNSRLISNGRTDAFFIHLDNTFNLLASNQIGGYYEDYGSNVKLDNNQDLLWTGCFSGEIQVNDNQLISSNGNLDVFVSKYNIDDKLIWIDQFGGVGNDYISSIETNNLNSIYICGSFKGSIEKGNAIIESKNSSSDVFLAKYDSDGVFNYVETFGSLNSDYARKLIVDTANYLYLIGNFDTKFAAHEDSTKNAIDLDFFLTRLYDCSFSSHIKLPADTTLCGTNYTIRADSNYIEYIWNEITGGPEFSVDTSDLYILEVKDKKKCISKDSILVKINREPIVDLGYDQILFHGEIIQLFAPPGMQTYQWNDQSKLQSLEINTNRFKEGAYNYSVIVTDTNSCIGKGAINITIIDLLNEDHINAEELRADIFPNPAKNQFNIKLQNIDVKCTLEIGLFSLNGTKLLDLSPKLQSSKLEIMIETQDFNAGTYLVLVKNGTTTLKKNVVIIK